ncbi:MAG: serine hydrolase [Saprospiraceae bacterium]
MRHFSTLLLLFLLLLVTACEKEPLVTPNIRPTITVDRSYNVNADEPFELTIVVSDPDGDAVSVSIENLPDWLDFNATSLLLAGTPTRDDAGEYDLKIIANDGEEVTERNLELTVIVQQTVEEQFTRFVRGEFLTSTQGMSGVSAALISPDGELVTATFGDASPLNEDLEMNADLQFRVASVSKTFTAALALKLVEEGHFNLTDNIADYLDVSEMENGELITIEQLLQHSSGLIDHLNMSSFYSTSNTEGEWTNDLIIDYASKFNSLFTPGTDYEYSNTGIYLMGAVIESALQQDLSTIFNEKLIEPLGLTQTFYDDYSDFGQQIDNLALNARSYEYHPTAAGAAGAMVSSPQDVVRFSQQLFSGNYLSPMNVDQMIQNYGGALGGDDYGLGTRLWEEFGIVHYGHTGSLMDYRSVMMYVPSEDISIAISTNDPHENWFDLVNNVLRLTAGIF